MELRNKCPPSQRDNKPCGIDWSLDEDRLLVLQMAIKLSDVNGPTKMRNLHISWTKAICEEFYTQGDEERRLGVKVSPFMNRSNPQVAELQRMFINNLIVPIVKSFSKAGVLAGECPQDVLIEEEEEEEEETDDSTSSPQSSPTKLQEQKYLLMYQLQKNLAYWKTKDDTDT